MEGENNVRKVVELIDRPRLARARILFVYVARLTVGGMFIYSSLPKICQPYDFLASVYSYELVGPKLGMLIAMALPWLEVMVGVCLIGGIFIDGALLASLGMALLFTFVLASGLHRGLRITCGCFGASATEVIGYGTLIRASLLALLSASAYGVLLPKQACSKLEQ